MRIKRKKDGNKCRLSTLFSPLGYGIGESKSFLALSCDTARIFGRCRYIHSKAETKSKVEAPRAILKGKEWFRFFASEAVGVLCTTVRARGENKMRSNQKRRKAVRYALLFNLRGQPERTQKRIAFLSKSHTRILCSGPLFSL